MGKKRAIILVVTIALIGAAVAAYFSSGSAKGGAESVRTTNVGALSASARGATSTDSLIADITATIYQMDRLELDPSIFNSIAFMALQDRTQVIQPEIPGRENPFAPLYAESRASSSRSARPGTTGGLFNFSAGAAGGSASGTPPILMVR